MFFLLILYFAFLLGYIVYSGVAVYHLNRFGYVGDMTKPVMFLYLLISATVIVISFIFISTLSWPTSINY